MRIISWIAAIATLIASFYYGPIVHEYDRATWFAVLALINWLNAQEDR